LIFIQKLQYQTIPNIKGWQLCHSCRKGSTFGLEIPRIYEKGWLTPLPD